MKTILVISAGALLAAVTVATTMQPTQTTPMNKKAESLHEFKMKRIDGKEESLSKYKGKVVLAVNVASKCGLTPQYEALEATYEKYKDKGFVVLGFPANQFNGQEPGTDAEIAEFCKSTYDVKFPMFSKIVVKGEETHPLYQWLLSQTDNHNDIEWNFAKFLIGKDGKVIARYAPRTVPDDKEIIAAIEKALAE